MQVYSKATGLSVLHFHCSSVLTDWHGDPGTYTSVELLTASLISPLIPLSMRVLLGVKRRSLRVVCESPDAKCV